MLPLDLATAFVVECVEKQGKLHKLGKMKIFKILYLADWQRFKVANEPMFNIAWYRIQKGPALKPDTWQNVLSSAAEKYGINAQWEQPGRYQQLVFSSTKPLKVKIHSAYKKYLVQAINIVIDATADEAAQLTYQTEPMQWLVAEELSVGAGVQFRDFQIRNDERIKFAKLAKSYKKGNLNISEIRRQMGVGWTDHSVVLFLEIMRAGRDLSKFGLTTKNRARVLKRLSEISRTSNAHLSSRWVEDSVRASQRIEGIYVPLDGFVEDVAAVW